jgi:diguanylate cyclase (GGDEF)-like protein
VNDALNQNGSTTANAARELANLLEQTEAARLLLARLQHDVIDAESHLGIRYATELREANGRLVIATIHAQTEAEAAARTLDEVSRSARLDALTELPNRILFLDRFAHAIVDAKRHGTQLALLFVDINNFKQINDTLGHVVGDQVLKLAAMCLTSSVGAADTVSRYGGDEFLILLASIDEASDATRIADKIIAALGVPSHANSQVLSLTASIGISIYPDDGEDADLLIDRADTAMYRAKKNGVSSFCFNGKEPSIHGPQALISVQHPLVNYEQTLAEFELRHGHLREANRQLVLAALSAQQLQAAAEQAQQRQTELLAVVAHELRNPLAPMRTAAALLGQPRLDESVLPRVQAMIERQVVHMSRLVGDLLDVSRVSTGKLRLERRVVDMADIIDVAVEACRPAMDARLQRFGMQMPPNTLEIHGDPVRLAQIFSNLLDNASKYTPKGGAIGLVVEVVNGAFVMTLSDNGIGITAEALPKVFEPFVQDTYAIGFNGVGLGIGLTVVRELVEAHGGNVYALSAGSGLGSRFVVTLPLIRTGGHYPD